MNDTIPALGTFRTCYDNIRADLVPDTLTDDVRARVLLYTYASEHNPETRFVVAPRLLMRFPLPGLDLNSGLTREAAYELADHAVRCIYGEDFVRANPWSLDVSPRAVVRFPGDAA